MVRAGAPLCLKYKYCQSIELSGHRPFTNTLQSVNLKEPCKQSKVVISGKQALAFKLGYPEKDWCWRMEVVRDLFNYTWSVLYDAVSGHVESLSGSVLKNLTLHRVNKYFSFYHHKTQILSFPTMFNTWGCSLGRNGPKT